MTVSLTAKLTRIDSQVWYKVLPVKASAVQSLIEDKNKRIICEISPDIKFCGALLSDGQGDYFILLNNERCKKLGLVLGEEIEFKLTKDESELGMPMSEELSQVLDEYPEAKAVFDSCTPGKKRTLIYWSDNVKSAHIKIRRAIVLCEHLISNGKDVDFKALGQEIKAANQLAKLNSA